MFELFKKWLPMAIVISLLLQLLGCVAGINVRYTKKAVPADGVAAATDAGTTLTWSSEGTVYVDECSEALVDGVTGVVDAAFGTINLLSMNVAGVPLFPMSFAGLAGGP